MNAAIQLDDTFPHATPDGYRRGCKGRICPGLIPCRDVHTRYIGDFSFRRRMDAGMTATEIVSADDAAAAAVRASEKAAQRQARLASNSAKAEEARRKKREKNAAFRAAKKTPDLTEYRADVKRLVGEGLTDREIAEKLGKERNQIATCRRDMFLKGNASADVLKIRAVKLHSEGLNNVQIASELGRHPRYIGDVLRALDLKAHPYKRPTVVGDVLRMHADGVDLKDIASRVDRDFKYIQRIIRESTQPPATSGVLSSQEST